MWDALRGEVWDRHVGEFQREKKGSVFKSDD
jgi:hypothetical protein